MSARTFTLPAEAVPQTAQLLRAVFGTQRIPMYNAQGDLKVEAALLGLDWARLVATNVTKLPLLWLEGPEGCGKRTFFYWVERLIGVRLHWCTDLEQTLAVIDKPGLIVCVDPSPEVVSLVGMANTTEWFRVVPPAVKEPLQVQVRARFAVVSTKAPDQDELQCPCWHRRMAAGMFPDALTLDSFNKERLPLTTYMNDLPLMTSTHGPYWFPHELVYTLSSAPTKQARA